MDAMLAEIRNFRLATPMVATSGQPQEHHFPLMAAEGYKTVINLALHTDPRYSLADEAASVRAAGLEYVHIPVQFADPRPEDFAAFAAAMDRLQAQKTWVHCAANMRVTAFLGIYRVTHQDWAQDAAFELMRSVWEPDAVWSNFIAAQLAAAQRAPLSDASPRSRSTQE
jgi:protein tyrosine phosphatase (PTP) superfamily phosphohydrolase (DUF442 family)